MKEREIKALIDTLAQRPAHANRRVEKRSEWAEPNEQAEYEREQAALALGALGDPALPYLQALLEAKESDIRWWATRALAALGGPGAIAALIEKLQDPAPDVRACAALGLGVLKTHQAIEPLIRALADESAYVGRIAGNALIQIGPACIASLITALNDDSTAVRAGAARALVPLKAQDAIPALFERLDDESALVTYYAQEALEHLGVGMVLIEP
jgi:HEAT repeat protein